MKGVNSVRRALLRGAPLGSPSIRPPWALEEPAFLEACTRCLKCVAACPQGILRAGDGGFAEVSFSAGECTFCGACVDACEPRALVRGSAVPWRHRISIDEASCLACQGVFCQSCRDACPEGAIRFAPSAAIARPVAAVDRCTGCGACVSVCPSGAVHMGSVQEKVA